MHRRLYLTLRDILACLLFIPFLIYLLQDEVTEAGMNFTNHLIFLHFLLTIKWQLVLHINRPMCQLELKRNYNNTVKVGKHLLASINLVRETASMVLFFLYKVFLYDSHALALFCSTAQYFGILTQVLLFSLNDKHFNWIEGVCWLMTLSWAGGQTGRDRVALYHMHIETTSKGTDTKSRPTLFLKV